MCNFTLANQSFVHAHVVVEGSGYTAFGLGPYRTGAAMASELVEVDSELIEVDSYDEEVPQDTFAEFFSPPRVAPWVWQLGGTGDLCVDMISRGGAVIFVMRVIVLGLFTVLPLASPCCWA